MEASPLTPREKLFHRQLTEVGRRRLVYGLIELYQANLPAIPGEISNAEMLGRLLHLLASLGGPPEPRRYIIDVKPPNPLNILMGDDFEYERSKMRGYDGDVSDNESLTSLDISDADSGFTDDTAP